ncbi:substrate-binding periplasmic protein [Salidesulfovibrio brasiliensis]|uniref:substrate-binding periplasmic protein n=1 Tax=Salidesulfovibrio brasiliensis TaxID=221711 RepID=UPI0006D2B62A|nr:transporter substrate-binding domain-containing protein [Salidesulfovibrio brasiliensis]
MKRLLLGCAIAFLLFATPVSAETITFVTNEWAPYASENAKGMGFTTAIVKEACKRAGVDAKFKIMPWKRCLATVKKGQYDAVYNAYYNEERAKIYHYTDDYATSDIVIAIKKGNSVNYDGSVESLRPYTIGVLKGYVNTAEFDKADYIKKEEATDEPTSLEKLMGGRVDAVSMDKFVALATMQNDPDLKAKADMLEILSPPLGTNKIYAMFTRNKPGIEQKVEAFNKGLAEIKADGTIEKIMKEYGF